VASVFATAITTKDTIQGAVAWSSMMRANELVRNAREQQGMTQEEVAVRSRLTIHEYVDIEQHADEIYSALPLAAARRVCSALNLDLSELLAAEQLLSPPTTSTSAQGGVLRHQLVRDQRIARSASISDVANAIGFDESAVALGESKEVYLESLPIRVLIDWARYLGLDTRSMLIL
jgi:DNA-binding XRE family transcriptional regulator